MKSLDALLRLHPDHSGALWIEPDLAVIDSLVGPQVLRLLADHRQHPVAVDPERVRIILAPGAVPGYGAAVRALESMRAFADEYGIAVVETDEPECLDSCSPLADDSGVIAGRGRVVISASRRGSPRLAADGDLWIGVESVDLAAFLASGRVWVAPPPVLVVHLHGPPPGAEGPATVHDVAAVVRAALPTGPAIVLVGVNEALWPHPDRLTLAALLRNDDRTVVINPALAEQPSPTVRVEVATIRPVVEEAGVVRPLEDCPPLAVDRVYIGSCTTGRVDDLRPAAALLHGAKVTIPTVISPASVADFESLQRERLGPGGPTLAEVFVQSGCDIGMPGCGSCVNALGDTFRPGTPTESLTVLTTAAASVATRKAARVLTASPITAAQTALAGSVGR